MAVQTVYETDFETFPDEAQEQWPPAVLHLDALPDNALLLRPRRPRPRVSIVIPTLNEARNLPHVLTRIPRDTHEVILVDGFSTDDTIEVARALYPTIKVVSQTRRGKGNALQCGFEACTGDIVVMLDADGSADPAEIERFVDALVAGVARESRHGTKVAFILLDLDHFKLLNDRHGHQLGDTVLQKTATCLLESVRVVDTVYRYGGEEFAVLMPDTDESGALVVAERLRTGIVSYAFGAGVTVTVSLGISLVPAHACSAADVIKSADLALYEAKRRGRNQAVMERTPVTAMAVSA